MANGWDPGIGWGRGAGLGRVLLVPGPKNFFDFWNWGVLRELGGLRVLFFDDFEQLGFLALKIPGFSQITRSLP